MLMGTFVIIKDGEIKFEKVIDDEYKDDIKGIDNIVLNELKAMSPEDLAFVEEEFNGKAIFRYLGETITDSDGKLIGFINELEEDLEIEEEPYEDIYEDINPSRDLKTLVIDWRV